MRVRERELIIKTMNCICALEPIQREFMNNSQKGFLFLRICSTIIIEPLFMKGAIQMKFVYTEKKTEVPAEIHAYAEKKISKLDRLFRGESTAYVTFTSERGSEKTEVTVKNNGLIFRASESTGDMHASIDASVAAIERQIAKNKTRLAKRLREGAVEQEISTAAAEPEESEFNVVRTKRFSIKPMSVEEAILQMNLLEHEFFVFKKDGEEGSFSVVYKRKDGGYGLIESTEE